MYRDLGGGGGGAGAGVRAGLGGRGEGLNEKLSLRYRPGSEPFEDFLECERGELRDMDLWASC